MSFLNPSALWLLPAAALPLVIHLVRLRSSRRVSFSDLSLIRTIHSRSLPSTRLRQWLLVLLRCLIIAGLAAAFARPVLQGDASAAGGSDAGMDLVILVDASWSMGQELRGMTRFDAAKNAALELLSLLRASDRAAAASFSEGLDSSLSWPRNIEDARDLASRLRPTVKTTDLSRALAEAYDFLGLQKGGRRRAVVVVSDGAAHALKSLGSEGLSSIPGHDPEIRTYGLFVENGGLNTGVVSVDAAAETPERFSLEAKIFDSLRSPGVRTLDLILKDRLVDQQALPSDLSSPIRFKLSENRDPDFWGRLSLRPDALALDDSFFFSLRVKPRPKVLLISGHSRHMEAGKEGYFLKKLLEENAALPFLLETADAGRLSRIDLKPYQAVVLADFHRLPDGFPEAIEPFVAAGGGLFVIAGSQADPETYRPLQRVLPVALGAPQRHSRSQALDLGRFPGGGEFPAERFSWKEFELSRIVVERSYALELRENAEVWFTGDSGKPLFVSGLYGRGRAAVWASSLDLNWSNLALKPAFTAWTDAALRWLTRYSGRAERRMISLGRPLTRVWDSSERAPAKVSIRSPGGRISSLLVKDRAVSFLETREPGLYFLQSASGEQEGSAEVFAVNADRSGPEGDLTLAKRAVFDGLLGVESLKEDVLRIFYGRETHGAVLACILLLLLGESYLARTERRS